MANTNGKHLLDEKNNLGCFSGIIYDNDLLDKGKGYVFDYFFVIKSLSQKGDVVEIEEAEFGVGTRYGLTYKSVDVKKEIVDLKKELKKYQRLAHQQPHYIGQDGLTYAEVAQSMEEALADLENCQEPLLAQIKLQLLDRLNTEESNVREIDFHHIRVIPFISPKIQNGKFKLSA